MFDSFLKEITDLSELPFDTVFSGYRCVNFGGKTLYVQGHGGIASFGADKISLRVGKRRLEITGGDLSIKKLSADDVVIAGRILSIVEQ